MWYRPPVSDDDRQRRRMGDATKGRIADLASGWDVPPDAKGTAAAAEPPPAPAPPPRAPAPSDPPPASGPPQSTVAGELPPRRKARTMPPPPPGSPLRTKPPTVETPIVGGPPPPTAPAPTAAPTAASTAAALPLPPPPPAGDQSGGTRSKPATRPPPIPAAARAKPDSRPPPIGDENELTIPDSDHAKRERELTPPPPLAASGFDQHQKATVQPDPSKAVMKKILDATPLPGPDMRPSSPGFDIPQMTVKEDAPLGLRVGQGHATAVVDGPRGMRGDPTVVPTGDDDRSGGPRRGDPSQASTKPFERGDPTGVEPPAERGDATVAQVGPIAVSGSVSVRQHVSLPRKRGVLGDVRYVFTVLFGVSRARRESIAVATELAKQLAERKERLVALGRAAVVSERFDHPALTAAREQLATIEDERSQHAGGLEALDSELDQIKRERTKRSKQTAETIAAEEKRVTDVQTKLEPLEREAQGARRRAADLHDQLKRLDARIQLTEASLLSIKTKREDKPAVQAEIATLKADRQSIQRDEPQLAAELDALTPRIAALEAARTEAVTTIAELREAETIDERRVEELVAAIEARRKVVGRSHSDSAAARDKALYGLADRLLIDRPKQLGRAFEPIDELELAIGTNERRAMELRELQGSVDKRAMARGITVMVLIVAAAGAGVVLALTQ